MNAPTPNTGGAREHSLTAEARHFLSRRFIERVVARLGIQEVFLQSTSWKGYDRACDTWHAALWNWVDQEIPADFAKRLQPDWSKMRNPDSEIWAVKRSSDDSELRRFDWEEWTRRRKFDWSKLPCAVAERKRFLVEVSRQELLLRRAVFQLAMRGADATDSETYDLFADDIALASHIADDSYNKALAKLTQRKPSKDKGDRRLKHQLLLTWIPGCLWAFATEGVAQFLQARYPRSQGQPYHPKSISDACRDLKLYRSPLPLWWGMSGPPPRLVSLR